MGKHYGDIIIEDVLSLKAKGLTYREIGQQLGYNQKQIAKLVERYNSNQRKLAAGVALKKKGRPPKGHVVSEQDKLSELKYVLNRKDYRIKQLERENELLRDFLKEVGRM